MSDKKRSWSRRDFLQSAGSAGVGAMLAAAGKSAMAADAAIQKSAGSGLVPTRPFGKSKINVSILSLGGMFNIPANQLLLKQALKWGVSYWDTADCYGWGRSEKGIGKYFKKYPQDRKKVFLVTKSDDRDPDGMTRLLVRSLKRMNTSYVDLYFVHGIDSIDELDNDTRAWAEKAKSEGKIRLFGFSTHSNMEECMIDAAKLGWIDGIMMTYNYRLMHSKKMKLAVKRCVKAGIGLTAMKTQGGGSVKTDSEIELELAGRFLQKGFTDAQAKLKGVWENPKIASICSQMPNLTILMSNIAAARDKTKLSATDMKLFKQFAVETASDYCKGCSRICESVLAEAVPIGDVMRYLMYSRSYGDHKRARTQYRKLPVPVRRRIKDLDFSGAEEKCPQKMAIGRLMREAAVEFA